MRSGTTPAALAGDGGRIACARLSRSAEARTPRSRSGSTQIVNNSVRSKDLRRQRRALGRRAQRDSLHREGRERGEARHRAEREHGQQRRYRRHGRRTPTRWAASRADGFVRTPDRARAAAWTHPATPAFENWQTRTTFSERRSASSRTSSAWSTSQGDRRTRRAAANTIFTPARGLPARPERRRRGPCSWLLRDTGMAWRPWTSNGSSPGAERLRQPRVAQRHHVPRQPTDKRLYGRHDLPGPSGRRGSMAGSCPRSTHPSPRPSSSHSTPRRTATAATSAR